MTTIWENNMTYESEGNDNLKSKWCSLKLHHPSSGSGVTIGRGYDLSQRNPNQIQKELTDAGFPKEKIEVLVKAAGLTDKAADEFVKAHGNFVISVNEQRNLFSVIYPQYLENSRRIFAGVWDKLPECYQEILVDYCYRGDIKKHTRNLLKSAAEKLAKGDSADMDRIIQDRAFWKNRGCNENRINRRIKKLMDCRDANNSSVSTTDSSPEINLNFPKGGVDLSLNNFDEKFCGLVYDKDLDEFLICQPSAEPPQKIKKPIRRNLVSMNDLGVILKVFYDPTIKSKQISFSLDPFEKNNPQGPFMRKVFFPDQIEGRRILAGTKLGEEMFKADFVMKQMSLGVRPDNKSKFEYPEELVKMGLRPQHEMREGLENTGCMKWSRSWIVVKDVGTFKTRGEMLLLDSLRMGVEGRQMTVMKDGTLKDSAIQDKKDECYKFSSKLGELYDLSGRYYESFLRLKEITNAIIMAKWIYESGVPVDMDLINEIYKANLLEKFEEKVPAINYNEILENEEKIPVDIKEMARRSLAQSKMEATPANLEMAIKQIKEKMPGKEFFDTRINRRQYFLFGGVDLSSNLIKTERNLLEEEKSEGNVSVSTNDSENCFGKVITRNKKRINVDLTDFNLKSLPLISREYCDICDNKLKVSESKNCRMWKKMLGDKHFCFLHNPYTCAGCLRTVAGTHMLIKERNYHPECVKCFGCNKGIKESAMVCEEGALFHKDCYEKHCKVRAEWMDDKLEGLISEKEAKTSGKMPMEKRKSEEIESGMNLMKAGEKDANRDRGKTTKEKEKPLIQKAVKKL